ncbi:hypothetical protein FGO68_gene14002 [Halteria grandinella]|uniref:Uncharacterized protein n=1 Tax=Halteria grandinella TaxID=5974 RepID=A0A8J8T8N1_HALGN|nr:hypothetical protein FGO68_gene14002 [Halteria grandinella]
MPVDASDQKMMEENSESDGSDLNNEETKDKEDSRTTYESCSEEGTPKGEQQEVGYGSKERPSSHGVFKNQENHGVQRVIIVDQAFANQALSTPQNCYNDKGSIVPKLNFKPRKERDSSSSRQPHCKTSRLSQLREEIKLIHFEEYDPLNANNRNNSSTNRMHTSGRGGPSQATSNSNRFSLSKTFNFHHPYLCARQQFDESDEGGEVEVDIKQNVEAKDQDLGCEIVGEYELSQRLDERFKQIAQEYSQLINQQLENDNGTQEDAHIEDAVSQKESSPLDEEQTFGEKPEDRNDSALKADIEQQLLSLPSFNKKKDFNNTISYPFSLKEAKDDLSTPLLNQEKGGHLSKRSIGQRDLREQSLKGESLSQLKLQYQLESSQCEVQNLKHLLDLKEEQLNIYEQKALSLENENIELKEYMAKSESKDSQQSQEIIRLKEIIAQMKRETKENQSGTNVGLSPIKLKEDSQDVQRLKAKILGQEEKIKKLEKDNLTYSSQLQLSERESTKLQRDIQSHIEVLQSNNLRWQQIEQQQQLLIDTEQSKCHDLQNGLYELKLHSKKKSAKIKVLKKERDNLRIEILKMKQMFSEKCDNYRESRHKLHKKIKKRDEKIGGLMQQVAQLQQMLEMRSIEERLYGLRHHMGERGQYPDGSRFNRDDTDRQHTNFDVASATGKFGVDLNSSQNIGFKSSMSSRSLENTRNLNSTAKLSLKQEAVGQEKKSNAQEKNNSSHPPRSKNYTPGSLPSGNAIEGGQYYKSYIQRTFPTETNNEDYLSQERHNQYGMYSRDELGQAKHRPLQVQFFEAEQISTHIKPAQQNQPRRNQPMPLQNPRHYVSNDKSKSFYSSDLENNTLFDNNKIIALESNSSNFFSNLNNSNSNMVFLDESSTMTHQYHQQPQYKNEIPHQTFLEHSRQQQVSYYPSGGYGKRNQEPSQKDPKGMVRITSNQQIRPYQDIYYDRPQSYTQQEKEPQYGAGYLKAPTLPQHLVSSRYSTLDQEQRERDYAKNSSKSPHQHFQDVNKKPQQAQDYAIVRNRSTQSLQQNQIQTVSSGTTLQGLTRTESTHSSKKNLIPQATPNFSMIERLPTSSQASTSVQPKKPIQKQINPSHISLNRQQQYSIPPSANPYSIIPKGSGKGAFDFYHPGSQTTTTAHIQQRYAREPQSNSELKSQVQKGAQEPSYNRNSLKSSNQR